MATTPETDDASPTRRERVARTVGEPRNRLALALALAAACATAAQEPLGAAGVALLVLVAHEAGRRR